MKTTKILGATTIAGALLFTGLGNADAAQTVNDSNIRDYAQNTLGSNYTKSGAVSIGGGWSDIEPEDHGIKDRGNYYDVVFHGEKDNGIGVAKVYKDGRVEARTPRDPDKVLSINAPENAQSTNDNNQATDNNSNAQAQNNEQSQSQATDNAKAENNTQSQNQSQALPETGEESSNTTLLTMVAAVVLAAGSLLTFKGFSKEK